MKFRAARNIEMGIILTSILLFCISFFLPSLYFQQGNVTILYKGFEVFILGWGAIFYTFSIAWYANPFYFLSLLSLFASQKESGSGAAAAATVFALIAILMGLTTFRLTKGMAIDHNSGTLAFQRLGSGSLFWIASLALVLVASLLAFGRSRSEEQKTAHLKT